MILYLSTPKDGIHERRDDGKNICNPPMRGRKMDKLARDHQCLESQTSYTTEGVKKQYVIKAHSFEPKFRKSAQSYAR
jgi:hypothetical protein